MILKRSDISYFSVLSFIVWGLAAIFFLYEFFLRTFIGSLAYQIIPDLGLNAVTFSIIASAYYIAYGIMQLPVGILTDRFGVKSVLIFATLICALATFIFAHANGFSFAFISRFAMGFGSSFAFVVLLMIAATWFPLKNFAFFAGVSQFIGTMGPLLAGGPLIAFLHVMHGDWRASLYIIAAFGLLLTVLSALFVKNKPPNEANAMIFLQREWPLKDKLITLIKNKQAWYIAIYSAAVYLSIEFLGAIWGTSYLQARGLSQQNAANIISVAWLGYAIGCPALGALSDFMRRRRPILIFCAVLGFISVISITYISFNHLRWVYAILFFLLGLAATGQNIGFATISEHVEGRARATALGLNNGAITISIAIIPPIASYFIYLATKGTSAGMLNPKNFIVGFTMMPIFYFISILLACFGIKETYCRSQKETVVIKVDS